MTRSQAVFAQAVMVLRGQMMTRRCLTMTERQADNYGRLRDALSSPQYSVARKSFWFR